MDVRGYACSIMRTAWLLAVAVLLSACAAQVVPAEEATPHPTMADQAAIPTTDDVIGAGTTAMVAARPSCQPFLLQGRYRDVVDGWRAQGQLAIKRMSDESAATRLATTDGDALKQLLASEFFIDAIPPPQAAIGVVYLYRTAANDSIPTHTWTAGTVPAGAKLRKAADPTKSPPIQAAEYVTQDPIFFDNVTGVVDLALGGGQFRHYQLSSTFSARIQATRVGPHANRQFFQNNAEDAWGPLVLADTLFDTGIAVAPTASLGGFDSDFGGGSSAFTDADLRMYGKANYAGQFGPTRLAVEAGLWSTGQIKRFAISEDTTTGTIIAWVTDESWGYSQQLASAVKKYLTGAQGNDPWIGFGCKVTVLPIFNWLAGVSTTVVLRDAAFLQDTSDITNNIRLALRSYFDDRPDWYIVRGSSLAATIASADRRILSVPSVPTITTSTGQVLNDANFPSAPLSATNAIVPIPALTASPVHVYLSDNGVTVNYLAPQ